MEQDIEHTPITKSRMPQVGKALKGVLSGEVFGSDKLIAHLPYGAFLVFLGLVYIAIGYAAEDMVRQINRHKSELKEMRSEYITIKSDLMYATKQSELVKILQQKGIELTESLEPPKKIEVSSSELETYNDQAVSGQ